MKKILSNYKNVLTQVFLKDSRVFDVFLFGIISGMPFAILASLVPLWTQDYNMPIALITTYAVARMPYSFKFLWSPILDGVRLPFLYNIMGRRLSWMVLTMSTNMIILLILAHINPTEYSGTVKILLIIFGFSSATYDITYDGMRIDMLDEDQQGMGVASTGFGFKIGHLFAYSGGLIIADAYSWFVTFNILAIVFLLGLIMVFACRKKYFFATIKTENLKERFRIYCIEPFTDLFSKENALLILTAIVFYKLGEAMLAQVMSLFYTSIGFSKTNIATIVKLSSFIAAAVGSFIGAYILARLKLFKGLIVCDILQASTNLLYIWLHHSPTFLILSTTIFVDTFTGSLGGVALVTFLTSLCNKKYSATHYAILSSLATFANNVLTTKAGAIVESVGWDNFFIITVLLAIPGVIMVAILNYKKSFLSK